MNLLGARATPWLALALGAACSLSFAPAGLYLLGTACIAGLFWTWESASARRAALYGFAWGVGLFLAGAYWIFTAVYVFGRAPAWLALLLLLGLVAIMAAWYALLGWAVVRLTPRSGPLRWLVVAPAAWVLVEWARGWVLSGFPWLQAGYAHIDSPLSGLAPVGGVHLVGLAAALTAGGVLAAILGTARQRASALLVLAVTWVVAAALQGRAWTAVAGDAMEVAVVQGAVPQDLKWDAAHRRQTLELYQGLNREALGARLIVWPEAALPMLADQAMPFLTSVWRESVRAGSHLMIGLLRYDANQDQVYNGLIALGDEDPAWYYKRRLVPFGEFFPVPATVRRWMRLMSLAYSDLTPGPASQPALRVAGQRVGVTICYEDAYGAEQLAVLDEATLLVNVTNNAWFGDSNAPHQQLQMARFRALEAGRYLVRATSNGISAVIGPEGGLRARAEQFVPVVLRAEVRPHTGLTPYARVGNGPILLLCLLGLMAALFRSQLSRRRRL
ncbi:MAG: apolipoprotein N-acyltransferase [Steroidobacteraceae bacterium]|jgi:apolipoprotein N-acyltransferase